ncbi:hypothetical protein BGZ74_011832 [Mortierella antarctica]|nr:hypothetical protein BGZ74_011832 [Mortierella antarctica]
MKITASVAILALAASQAMAVVPLRKDCLNLDEGHPICVSVTPGAGTLEPRPTGPVPPVVPPVVPPTTPTTSGAVVPPVKPTSGFFVPTGVVPPPVAPGASSSAAPASPTPVKPVVNNPDTANKASGAEGTKASMVVAAAGVLLSVAYML